MLILMHLYVIRDGESCCQIFWLSISLAVVFIAFAAVNKRIHSFLLNNVFTALASCEFCHMTEQCSEQYQDAKMRIKAWDTCLDFVVEGEFLFVIPSIST